MIEALTFDFWDTLVVTADVTPIRRQLITQALPQDAPADLARIDIAMTRAWREWDRLWLEEHFTFGASRWVTLVLEKLDVKLSEAQQEKLVLSMSQVGKPPLVKGIKELLPRLARCYRLGLICDTGLTPGSVLRQWMEQYGILDYFTQLTFSDELGISKPNTQAFLTTLNQLNTSPQAAVHIGDYPRTDIAGAQAVGMRAIRFAGVHDRPDAQVQPDAEIWSYDELEPILESWS